MMKLDAFLTAANSGAKARIFSEGDYARFAAAAAAAKAAARKSAPYYASDDQGSVSNAYGHAATTAQWAVWTTPAGQVVEIVRRTKCSGNHVTAAFRGGEKAYQRWFASAPMTLIEAIKNHANGEEGHWVPEFIDQWQAAWARHRG
jgi:hypothetical protein